MTVNGSVSFELKSKANQLTVLDFGSLFVGDGCMVITFGGQAITYDLLDL